MAEIRKDYFTNRLVVVSAERSRRPQYPQDSEEEGPCPLCPGNERMTPPADLVLLQKEGSLVKLSDTESETVEGWSVRVFPNKHPIVSLDPKRIFGDPPLYSEPAYGYHYVVSATPNHNEAFPRMELEQWINNLATIQDKTRALYSKKGVSYVTIYINSGKRAGASIVHPHFQIVTLPRLPPLVEEEAVAVQKSMYELGVCPVCSVLNVETGGPRQVLATDSFVALCPWASTHSFEYWIFPRKHQTSFLKATQKEIRDLALIARATLGGLAKVADDPPFNLVFHTSSEKKATRQIHWHIEVYPQLTIWAGLEKGSGVYVNEYPPELAARTLGMRAKAELAELVGV